MTADQHYNDTHHACPQPHATNYYIPVDTSRETRLAYDKDTNTTTIPPIPESDNDPVNHPAHYTSHPSGVECIEITEHMGFSIGNAVKYLWRAGLKNENAEIEDLRKAVWYINREIERREKFANEQG